MTDGDRRPPDRRTGERLAEGLGWFSIGLGVPQVLVPGHVNRLIGVDDSPRNRAAMRAVGFRELAGGAGVLDRPRPAGFLFARVAGDAIDLLLLGSAMRSAGRHRRHRLAAATVAVAGVTVLDAVATAMNSRSSEPSSPTGQIRARASVTVNRPVEEAYRFWRDLENLPRFMAHLVAVEAKDDHRSRWVANGPAGTTVEWDAEVVEEVPGQLIAWRSLDGADIANSGSVRFAAAPGGRGTEVRVDIAYEPPAGAVGAAVARLFGEDPQQQAKDDLRRFKQVLETGEVVRSDGSPQGTRAQAQLHQHDAQPLP